MDTPPPGAPDRLSAPVQQEPVPPAAEEARFGRANWILFVLGCVLMVAGYAFLAQAGRTAGNAFGKIAPFCVVGGLVVFGLGFVPQSKGK